MDKHKLKALAKLRDKMSEMGGGMMKATIMAKDEQGLKEGAEKLEEVMEGKMESGESECPFKDMSRDELVKMLKEKSE